VAAVRGDLRGVPCSFLGPRIAAVIVPGTLSPGAQPFPEWDAAGRAIYRNVLLSALRAATHGMRRRGKQPLRATTPSELATIVERMEVFPAAGEGIDATSKGIAALISEYSVDVSHPRYAAHLHSSPLLAALAAEVLISGLNQSMDSWDQSPIATHIEQRVVSAISAEIGFDPATSAGAFTGGGTQSNLMGLLLARNAAAASAGWDAGKQGLAPEARRFRIVCSESAHFSIQRSAAVLGLGEDSVLPVEVGPRGAIDLAALDRVLDDLVRRGLRTIAIVATAGATDRGAIDEIRSLAERARRQGSWLHVDAAYGGALIFSQQHAAMLDGLVEADSASIDFHKLLWQPLPCSVIMVRRAADLDALRFRAAYLNPEDDEMAGITSLVGVSPLQTSRRFDALKVLMSFRAVGREAMGLMVDRTIHLASCAANFVLAEPVLDLLCEPCLTTVLFRYRPGAGSSQFSDEEVSRFNAELRRNLLRSGRLIIGRADIRRNTYLRLVLMNPSTTEEDVAGIVRAVVDEGRRLEGAPQL